jgi:NAD(P)-dependent dehydrogenase (short-subunit alcohol dehydrogenase family)
MSDESSNTTACTAADLEGRVCVITGANTGIGRATADALARRGAKLVLACRSEERARPVADAIGAETGADVDVVALDLASLASVRAAADALLDRLPAIHILINNGGLPGRRGAATADGFELAFGVNHMGHFLLTTLLLDRLRASAPARVVTVSSQSHYRAKRIDWDAVRRPGKSLIGMREYEVSKLANVLFSAELARRTRDDGVTTYSLHPGVIASDIWRRIPWPVRPLVTRFMKTNEEGAATSIYCAASPQVADESGLYYDDCATKRPSRLSQDEALAAELWRRSEQWCQELA